MPSYPGRDGQPATVPGATSEQCPVAVINPQSRQLVQIYARSKRMTDMAGASLHGANLGDWPARTVDAFITMDGEEHKVDNAQS